MDVHPQRLLEQRVRDEEAVGADDDGVDRDGQELGPLRLVDGDPEPLGSHLRRRRGKPAAPALRRVRPREQVGDLVVGREPLEHVGAEGSRRGDGERH